ncbi:unnamed protein product, partial [Closterium sp. NIES-54]
MWLLLLLVAASHWSSRAHAKTVMGDVSALQVFKLSVSNASALADWEGFEPCKKEWFGVNCGESTRSKHRWAVVSIELPNCNLGGEIPEAIGDLVELTKLDLRNNNFTGLLPASLSRLTALESLDVSGNPFEVAPSTNLTPGAPPPLTSDPISIIPEPDAPGPKIPRLVKTGRKKGSGRKGRGKKGRGGKAGKRGNSTAEPPAAEPPTTKPLVAAKPPTVKPLPAAKPPAVKPPAVKPPAVKPPVGTIPPKSSPDKVRLPAVPLEPPTNESPDSSPVPGTTRSPSLPPKSVSAPSDETASPLHSAAGETKTPAIEVPPDNAGSTSSDSSDSSSGSSSSDNSTASLGDSSLASTSSSSPSSSSSPPPAPAESPSTNSIALYVGIAAGVVVAFLLGVALVLLYIYLRRRRTETKDFASIKDVAAGADGRGGDYGTAGAVAAAGYAAGNAGKRGGGGGGVFGRLWPGTGKVADLGTVSAYQQQAHAPAAPSAAVPAHDHGANLLPPHDPSAMIPHSGASNHSGWGAAVSAVHSGVHSVTVEGGAVSPYAPASAYASAAEPGSNMSSQFPSRTPSQTPSQPMSHVAGPGIAAAIAAEAGGGTGGGEGGSGGGGGGYAAHSSNSSAQTPGASVGSLKSGRNMAEYRLMLPGRSLSNTVMELTYEDVLVSGLVGRYKMSCDAEQYSAGSCHAIVYHSPTCNLIPHPLVLQQVVLLIESTQVAASGASGGLLQCRGEQGAGVQSHVSPPSPPSLPSPPSHHPISLVGGAAESAQVAPSSASAVMEASCSGLGGRGRRWSGSSACRSLWMPPGGSCSCTTPPPPLSFTATSRAATFWWTT